MFNRLTSIVLSFTTIALFFVSCATVAKDDLPSWFLSPKQNDSSYLYGTAEGATLEGATKYALSDCAARLMVSISSESSLTREENTTGANEELRQKVQQNVEKIGFSNFKVTKSEQSGQRIFVEVKVERDSFVNEQKERVEFLNKQITNLEKETVGKSIIQKRNALLKISELGKELELKSRILNGLNEGGNLKETMARLADFQSQLNSFSDKIEFYFEIDSPKEIAKIVRKFLNKEQIKIANGRNPSNKNQVVIRVKSDSRSQKIYGSFVTKVEVDFENIANGKIAASNTIEVSGSSVISEKESYLSALASLEEEIERDGIMKVLGLSS